MCGVKKLNSYGSNLTQGAMYGLQTMGFDWWGMILKNPFSQRGFMEEKNKE